MQQYGFPKLHFFPRFSSTTKNIGGFKGFGNFGIWNTTQMCSGTTFLIFIRFFCWILGFWVHTSTTHHLVCTTWKKLTLKKTMFQCWSDYTCLQHRIYSSNPCQNNCSIQCTQRKNNTLGPFWRLFLLYVGQTQFWKGPVPSFIIDILY